MPDPTETRRSPVSRTGDTIHVRLDDRDQAFDTSTWVTLNEAADAVGISSSTLRRAAGAGTIRGQRAGGSQNSPWLVHLGDVKQRWNPEPDTDADPAEPSATHRARVREAPQLPSEIREQFLLPEPKPKWWEKKAR